ncbi:MAG TPA: type II secretion system protein [Blastocatellia bacterium]|nr:type II secretion system protein [Blastocatellia bacterium]
MANPARTGSRVETHSLTPDGQRGYSAIELVIVTSIVIILAGITIYSLTAGKKAYAADDEATQLVSFFREAYHRALAQRQTMRVTIDRNQGVVRLMDEGAMPGGDEVEIIRGRVSQHINMDRPAIGGTPIAVPPSPYNYNPAVFDNGVWSARFRADGSVVDAAGNSLSATLYFSPIGLTEDNAGLIRAVTLFGPSGSVRFWKYDISADTFVTEAK